MAKNVTLITKYKMELEILDISHNFLSSPLDLSPLHRLKVISLGQRNLAKLTKEHFLKLPTSLSSLEISDCLFPKKDSRFS